MNGWRWRYGQSSELGWDGAEIQPTQPLRRRDLGVNTKMTRNRIDKACWLLILLGCALTVASAQQSFDTVITNGHIIDGTGSPWYSGDVGIRNGKIAAIGNLSEAARARTIDAAGKVVAPGFIDMLGQSEMTILVDPR